MTENASENVATEIIPSWEHVRTIAWFLMWRQLVYGSIPALLMQTLADAVGVAAWVDKVVNLASVLWFIAIIFLITGHALHKRFKTFRIALVPVPTS
jgi:hypothetical protein